MTTRVSKIEMDSPIPKGHCLVAKELGPLTGLSLRCALELNVMCIGTKKRLVKNSLVSAEDSTSSCQYACLMLFR